MKQLGKKIVILATALSLSTMALCGCGKADDTDTVAKVGDQEIPYGVVNFYCRLQQAQLESYYSSMGQDAEELWSQEVDTDSNYEESFRSDVLEKLEDYYLMEAHMKDYGVELTDADNTAISEAVDSFVSSNEKKDRKVVSGEKKYVKKVLELLTISGRMEESMKSGVDEEVSDEEAAQKSMQYVFFSYTTQDENGDTTSLSDEEKEQQKQSAQSFLEQLKQSGSAEMETLASAQGLEMQTETFDSDSSNPAEEVVEAADALTTEGELAELVETDSGCYVVRLQSLLDREATDSKKQEIVTQRQTDQYNALLKEWRSDANIKEYKRVLKKIKLKDQGVTLKQETQESDGSESTSQQ